MNRVKTTVGVWAPGAGKYLILTPLTYFKNVQMEGKSEFMFLCMYMGLIKIHAFRFVLRWLILTVVDYISLGQ